MSAEHKPFIPPEQSVRELTIPAVVMGSLLGIVFAASSVYLGLKVGLTVSASIPVAVLSITLFRWLRLRGTILENNVAQTVGSAGESLAAGVAFTLPSLLLMGFDIELTRILLVALLGGLIGTLMMIPLRHGLIVKEHGKLTYPEGTACADVLVVGEKGGTEATMVFTGFGIGLVYAFFNLVSKLWADVAHYTIEFKTYLANKVVTFKGEVAAEVSPPMLGVGYIIGPKVSATMLAGGLLAFMVLMPLIAMLGGDTVAAMSSGAIRHDYILYIGAGAVATGGFISLGRSIPTIASAFKSGFANLRAGKDSAQVQAETLRTERDLPMSLVLGGSLGIAVIIFLAPTLDIDPLTALLVVMFGFFFVTVSSRITGEIGSSSNPISGMTIATLLLTCGLFVLLGRTGVGYKAMALSTAALVCVAASNGGTTSQDLKTGFLVGATPRAQQIAISVGVITSALAIGFVMLLLLDSRTTYQPVTLPGVTVQATDKTLEGPDGKTYKVGFLRDDVKDASGNLVTRGKYLIDDAGAPVFFADPAVDSAYPYRLIKGSGTMPKDLVEADKPVEASQDGQPPKPATKKDLKLAGKIVGETDGTELGVDHKSYRVYVLSESTGGVGAGRYLIDDAGAIAYAAEDVEKFDAPKAQLFALIIDGTLGGKLPWGMVLIGALLALVLELVNVSSLPFAVGLYLPISTSGGIFAGGVVRWLIDRRNKDQSAAEAEFSPGMLMASGLIAGGAIAGVVQSAILTAKADKMFDWSSFVPANETWWPMIPFLAMAGALYWAGSKKK